MVELTMDKVMAELQKMSKVTTEANRMTKVLNDILFAAAFESILRDGMYKQDVF